MIIDETKIVRMILNILCSSTIFLRIYRDVPTFYCLNYILSYYFIII